MSKKNKQIKSQVKIRNNGISGMHMQAYPSPYPTMGNRSGGPGWSRPEDNQQRADGPIPFADREYLSVKRELQLVTMKEQICRYKQSIIHQKIINKSANKKQVPYRPTEMDKINHKTALVRGKVEYANLKAQLRQIKQQLPASNNEVAL